MQLRLLHPGIQEGLPREFKSKTRLSKKEKEQGQRKGEGERAVPRTRAGTPTRPSFAALDSCHGAAACSHQGTLQKYILQKCR